MSLFSVLPADSTTDFRRWLWILLATLLPLQAWGATPSVSGGTYHSAAVHTDGSVRTWGSDIFGELGAGRRLSILTPNAVAGLTGITAISGSAIHTLALKNDAGYMRGAATRLVNLAMARKPIAPRRSWLPG